MKRTIIQLLLCLLFNNLATWSIAGQLPNNIVEDDLFITKILQNDDAQYFVEVYTKELVIKETELFGEKFSYVDAADFETIDIEGNPALPVYIQHIALPASSSHLLSASVEEMEWDTIKVSRIVPSQPPLLEGEVAKHLAINNAVYESGWYQPQLVKTTEMQVFRSIKNTNVIVCPFKYNAVSGKLGILRKFRLKVSFAQNNVKVNTPISRSRYYSLFNNVDASSKEFASVSSSSKDGYDYLIIVGNIPGVLQSDILKEFQMWKALRGIKTKVVTVDSIGCTDTSIKAYIQSQYASDSIKYVLFIGKAHHIPQHMMNQFVYTNRILRSDYWYGCMDGENDWEADIAIGRYSVNNLQELENAMKKTIKYEMGTNANGKNVLLVAHQQNANSSIGYQACMEEISNNSQYSNFSFIKEYGATVANGGTGATSESVVERINQGVGIFNYRGHAGPFFWREDWSWKSRPLFDSLMVSTLANEKYPIALSIACETGRIDSTRTCLMDLYMNGEHGISSGLGSTIESWSSVNNSFNKSLFAIINSENEGLGFINIQAHKKCTSNPTKYYKDNMFSYCCFGDPSLRVWTDSIKLFPEPQIGIASGSFTVSVENVTDYEIIVVSESDGLIAKYYSFSNTITIPLPSVSCTIAIHKKNYESYLFDYIATNYIQKTTIKRRTFASSSPIAIGNNVSTEIPTGDVVIEKGGLLQFKQNSYVTIPYGFECKLGGQLIVN